MHPVVRAILQSVKSFVRLGRAYFDGTGDRLTVPDSADLQLGKTFTIECIISKPSIPSGDFHGLLDKYESSSGWMLDFASSTNKGKVRFNCGVNGLTSIMSSTNVCNGAQHHIAVVGDGTNGKLYIDGISEGGSITLPTTLAGSGIALSINGDGASTLMTELYGYGVKITKDEALYAANFTPPTYFDVGANTKLCMNFAEAIGSTTFTDDTGKTVTTVGNVIIVA
jgi:hypothetical protein